MSIARVGIAALCLLGLSAAPVFAQDKGPTFGIDVGFSMSRISPDVSGTDISRGPGLLAGGFVGFQPWVPVGIQIELLYAQKHTHLKSNQDLSLDYLEIPLLARLKLFKGIYMLEGIAIDFPVSANVTTSGTSTDIKNSITSPDLGMIIAGGVPLAKKVAVEFRYEGGFKKVSNVDSAPTQRNRSLSGVLVFKLS